MSTDRRRAPAGRPRGPQPGGVGCLQRRVPGQARRPAGRQRRPGLGDSQIPEAELRVLGDVAGKDVLELGCGAAQWSIALAQARRAAGRARPFGAPARARPPADGRGRRRLPAGPRQRRGRAAPRRVVRHRLLRPRGDDLRRPVPDRPGGRPTAAPRRPVRVQPPLADRDDLLGARRGDASARGSSSTTSGCTASTTARRSSSSSRTASGSGCSGRTGSSSRT